MNLGRHSRNQEFNARDANDAKSQGKKEEFKQLFRVTQRSSLQVCLR